jgi:hypothetical protein
MSSNSCSLISDNRQATSDMPLRRIEVKSACPTRSLSHASMLYMLKSWQLSLSAC